MNDLLRVRLPESLKAKITELAAIQIMSASDVVRQACIEYVDRRTAKPKPAKQAAA